MVCIIVRTELRLTTFFYDKQQDFIIENHWLALHAVFPGINTLIDLKKNGPNEFLPFH
jgi:hypothetical protein